ncbi:MULTISPECIES: GGDEF domain-containing protein [unclassified Beijerinckia]|uniref:GGDEF domain-containing protein n=1 Tax=unclassified Beijerinckia TaxID=2638183 RepID=UPI001FCCF152|nr:MULTISPECIES: GGDEF domain-containing protein [unclassified Beijerinckia]
MGTLCQILAVPAAPGPNAVVSAFIYTISVLTFNEGLLIRSSKHTPWLAQCGILFLIVAGTAYFFYVDRNVWIRVYILNFGFGLICLVTAWRVRALRLGQMTERILFWTLLIFSIQFILRTLLTQQFIVPDATAFGLSPFWLALQYSLAVLGVALALALLGVAVGDVIEDLRRERAIDSLTGLLNRRGFQEGAAPCMHDPRSLPLSVVVADIDHFKQINDALGHAAGDEVLRTLGKVIRQAARRIDLCGRLGGEEFVLLLPNCDAEGAAAFAERLRAAISATRFAGLPDTWRVTASFGLAEKRPDESLSDLLVRADAALYRAKHAGRDRVERHTETMLGQPLGQTDRLSIDPV